MLTYKTIKNPIEALLKEKGSKFYAYAFSIANIEEHKIHLDKLKGLHPKARHFCSATLLGKGNNEYYLTNDDGEPNNSAGAPILGQIRAFELTNIYMVVIRYFGGTKLGVGGLIKAYKTVCSEALSKAEIITVEPISLLAFTLDYSLVGDCLSLIDRNNIKATISHKNNSAEVSLSFKEKDRTAITKLFSRYLN